MNLPLLARYADILRYDRERGHIYALDWRAYPDGETFVTLDSVEAAARAIEANVAGRWAAGYMAGYGLALAARAWADRPSDARRGALIQAGERLRAAHPADWRMARLIEEALSRADAAILSGANAEAAILDFVGSEIGRADRVAERCGRIAAGLLDDGDRVLVHGFPGPALAWMLAAARDEGKQLQLYALASADGDGSAAISARAAAELGVPATILDELALDLVFAREAPGLFFVGAERIALDGAVLAERGAAEHATLARGHSVPRYVLGYDGPDPRASTGDDLAGTQTGAAVVAPALISAIITNRGIYRPEMIARYLGDGEAPLDVIPLRET